MNMNLTQIRGPFTVETAESETYGQPGYVAIVEPGGGEVARVHHGDDSAAAKKLARQMAVAPQLHRLVEQLIWCAENPEEIAGRYMAESEALDLLSELRGVS
jgi:hypothetical protein